MWRLLIAGSSDAQQEALRSIFEKEYEVMVCSDGPSALELLKVHKPEVLILDLSLPMLDGIEVLRKAQDVLPSVILATTSAPTWYVEQMLIELGVGHILRKPCRTDAIISHIAEMRRLIQTKPQGTNARVAAFLNALGIATHLDGYQQLRVGIPMYAQDPTQNICKELYVNVAAICGKSNANQVERTVRAAIQKAWVTRDDSVWAAYFAQEDGTVPCPSNKVFIARLAEKLA